MRHSLPAWLTLLAALATPGPAAAHPHVLVTSRSEIVYDGQGKLTAIRHAWTFDDMFSSFAIQGLDTNKDGTYSRDELQPLAQTNVESLKDFDYFTFVKLGGKQLLLAPPTDYWLDYGADRLTLHFTLPLNTPQSQGQKALAVDIYDGTYFVAFSLDETAPATMSGADHCALTVNRPKPLDPAQAAIAAQLDVTDPGTLASNPAFGASLANTILVNCP
jgi:ABC-type uncharacterized transport system substrate-binding protein